jgi:hypothetical protein
MKSVALGLVFLSALAAEASVTTTSLESGLTAEALVTGLVGAGVNVSNVTYTGSPLALGTFTADPALVGFDAGVILSSGRIADVDGPNDSEATQTALGGPGDDDLDGLVPQSSTMDASVLEFDFVPTESRITFEYVFGSEEYNEFVGSPFNDVFGFFVNGVNFARLPDDATPVAINNVNNGTNPIFYVDNSCADVAGCTLDIEADGLTLVLSFTAPVNPGQTNHIKLAIADTQDQILDSWVFIRQGTFAATSAAAQSQPAGATKILTTCTLDDLAKGAGTCQAAGFAREPEVAPTTVGPGVAVPQAAVLKQVTKRAKAKKFKKGQALVKLKLNALGKRLLRDAGELDVLVRVTVVDRAQRSTALQRLVKLVRR